MKETRYFYCPDLAHGSCDQLPQEEAEHAVRVLRMQEGDEIFLTDGEGGQYRGEVTSATKKGCFFRILSQQRTSQLWEGEIHIAVAPTKNMDRMEWLAEKATEIGVNAIHLLDCQYSERKVVKNDRLERVIISALKQSHKTYKPELTGMTDFQKFIQEPFDGNKYIAHCYCDDDFGIKKAYLPHILGASPLKKSLVLIGPEGDFSIKEVRMALENGFTPVTLGKSRLRTETAALVSVMMMNLNNTPSYI